MSYDASEHNLVNGPFNLMVNRPGDKILGEDYLLAPKLARFRESIPEEEMLISGYEESQKFFDSHGSEMFKKQGVKSDPHAVKFNELEWRDESGNVRDGQELFAEYIERSSKWIKEHPEELGHNQTPRYKTTATPELNEEQKRDAYQGLYLL